MEELKQKALPRPQREVSDEEFRRAYYGDKRDPKAMKEANDNRAIIRTVCEKYKHKLDHATLQSCGMVGLLRALRYYRTEFNQKFTTSLYTVVVWECQREMRKRYGRGLTAKPRPTISFRPEFTSSFENKYAISVNEQISHLRECVDLLPEEKAEVFKMYHFDGMTCSDIANTLGVTRRAVRDKIEEATAELRQISAKDLV